MGKPTGFMEIDRAKTATRPVEERVKDFESVYVDPDRAVIQRQASRCMDCGVPFCNKGCPLGNIVPDWNDLVYRDRWKAALDRLHSTNNFPEFTGLVCPAPCEAACVLALQGAAVTIKSIEWSIIQHGYAEGWIVPAPAAKRTGKRVAVVGSGPAGLAASQQLARAGHAVTVFEKNARVGGLLRFGIPDFKLDKDLIDRRVAQMEAEGVTFRTGVAVGIDLPAAQLRADFDVVVLACGSEQPRDLAIEGRELGGIHFALDFLGQQNQRCAGEPVPEAAAIVATGKHVVVLGGGDTGSDCIGTAHRQGPASVLNLELNERPPDLRDPSTPWPLWPLAFQTTSSHEEGGQREFAALTQRFSGEDGQVRALHTVRVRLETDEDGRRRLVELPGTEESYPADLVLLAMGYVHPVHDRLLEALGVDYDPRGNVHATTADFHTSVPGVFAAGDVRRGQSLVVWAIQEGRECARAVDAWLTGQLRLPSRDSWAYDPTAVRGKTAVTP